MEIVVEANHIQKKYSNNKIALSDVSFSISKKECVALLGRSGASKSSLLRIILGESCQTSGEMSNLYKKRK